MFRPLSNPIVNFKTAVIFLTSLFIFGILGFMILEGYNFTDALYMVIITFSTVGYGEVRPISQPGKLFVGIFILLNILAFAYFLSVFSYYIIQGRVFKWLKVVGMKKRIEVLRDHVIVCGFGRYGKEVTDQFIAQKIPFVIIEKNPDVISQIEQHDAYLLHLEGNASDDDLLIQAGIEHASNLITALSEDSENLYVTLTAKQLNPELKVISRAHDTKAEKKLKLAGAKHVILPDQIGGFYMANLVSKPDTVEFFSFLTHEFESDVAFEEVHAEKLKKEFFGKQIKELNLLAISGANVIGCKTEGGKYVVNPPPETFLKKNTSLILIGDKVQMEKMKAHLFKLEDQ